MSPRMLALMAMVGLGIGACYKTSGGLLGEGASDTGVDAAARASSRCGESVREGYLAVDYCAEQGAPLLPAYTSKEGSLCFLDVRLVDAVPPGFMDTETCSTPPVTSRCFLEQIGLIGSVQDPVSDSERYSLTGYQEALDVCTLARGCSDTAEACATCEPELVFIPCEHVHLSSEVRPF